jgi:hypothetical protein
MASIPGLQNVQVSADFFFYSVYSSNCTAVRYRNRYNHTANVVNVLDFFSHHQGGIRQEKEKHDVG